MIDSVAVIEPYTPDVPLGMYMDKCGCLRAIPAQPLPKRRYDSCGVIKIDPSVVKLWIKLLDGPYKKASVVDVACSKPSMKVYRDGTPVLIADYDAFSVAEDLSISFYLDNNFLAQPKGWYTGDIYFNDKYCLSLRFRIMGCTLVATECRTDHEVPCAPQCNPIGVQPIPAKLDCEPNCLPESKL